MTKTEQAIALMTATGCTAYHAAKELGIAPAAVYGKLNDKAAKCPCCGHRLTEKQEARMSARMKTETPVPAFGVDLL